MVENKKNMNTNTEIVKTNESGKYTIDLNKLSELNQFDLILSNSVLQVKNKTTDEIITLGVLEFSSGQFIEINDLYRLFDTYTNHAELLNNNED